MQSEALDPNVTVMDTMTKAAPLAKLNDIKALLGRMMFSGKAMEKKVGLLCAPSPPPQARYRLVCLVEAEWSI